MAVAPRLVTLLGLLALLPVAAWLVWGRGQLSGVVTAVNVVLIVGSLALAMRSTRGEGEVFAP